MQLRTRKTLGATGVERSNTCVAKRRASYPIPPGYVPYLETLKRVEGGWRWLEPDGIRRGPSDWKPLVAEMSDVQKLVHLTARWTPDDIEDHAARQFDQAKATYEQTLTQELRGWGCPGSGVLGEGPELTAVRERVDWASTSVAHTYNYELAKEIGRIGEDAPKANRHVYAYRLYHGPGSWDKGYWVDKNEQIARTESMTMINAAKADFYERNPQLYELQGEAWVVPLDTVCDICSAYVAANPYDSMEVGYRRTVLPAHVNCIPPGHRILTTDGYKPVEGMKAGETVITHKGMAEVSQAFARHYQGLVYRLEVDSQAVELTGDHPVLTKNGWKPVQELLADEEILVAASSCDA